MDIAVLLSYDGAFVPKSMTPTQDHAAWSSQHIVIEEAPGAAWCGTEELAIAPNGQTTMCNVDVSIEHRKV